MARLSNSNRRLDRRAFLRGTLAGVGTVWAAGLAGLSCRERSPEATRRAGAPGGRAEAAGPLVEMRRVAAPGEVEVGPGQVYRSWFYDGAFPGPEIRVREGELLKVTLENRLPESTTIHWHGVPLPNPMDGVPGVTQEPVRPGGTFVYEFPARPAGTFMYHSHQGLQLDRGLLGPLIVEERDPHVAWDREHTLMLDDHLPGEPEPIFPPGGSSGGMRGMRGMRGMMDRRGRGRGGMMEDMGPMMGGMGRTPPYAGSLINGRLAGDPPVLEVRRGERVRLRVMNPSSATTFRFAVAGHRLTVTHADSRPVRPVEVDAVLLGMGERYDVLVEARNPGAWAIVAQPVLEVEAPAGRAVLRYRDAAATSPPAGQVPEGIEGGRLLALEDLRAVEPLPGGDRKPDRVFDLPLMGGMGMEPGWTIGGQAYPQAEPLEIRRGELVRVDMVNHSMMLHPMHLHGHFFQAGQALKDTVVVPAHMGRVSFQFVADNPGDWLFHCHNLYHLESGMARVFRYVE